MKEYKFNNGESRIVKQWSAVNQAWLVWREDKGHQSMMRVHKASHEAALEFASKVEFIKEIQN